MCRPPYSIPSRQRNLELMLITPISWISLNVDILVNKIFVLYVLAWGRETSDSDPFSSIKIYFKNIFCSCKKCKIIFCFLYQIIQDTKKGWYKQELTKWLETLLTVKKMTSMSINPYFFCIFSSSIVGLVFGRPKGVTPLHFFIKKVNTGTFLLKKMINF